MDESLPNSNGLVVFVGGIRRGEDGQDDPGSAGGKFEDGYAVPYELRGRSANDLFGELEGRESAKRLERQGVLGMVHIAAKEEILEKEDGPRTDESGRRGKPEEGCTSTGAGVSRGRT